MVAYIHDPNGILAEPLRSRSAAELLRGYTAIFSQLSASGLTPTFQITDNECPASFKLFLNMHKIEHQLAPSYDHRSNLAEKVIDTFKSHL